MMTQGHTSKHIKSHTCKDLIKRTMAPIYSHTQCRSNQINNISFITFEF